MKSKIEFLIVFCLVFIISSPVTASAREITVDDNSGADFVSIQEAVNNSVPGDKIIVRPGTYTENVLVNVKGLTIRSEPNNGNAQVKPLNESVSTFMTTADNITISGLNIIGPSQDSEKNAIFVYGEMNNLTGNTIENGCILLGPERGHNLIAENKISNSKGEEGIHISCCGFDTNIVSNNTISNCSIGIYEYDQAADIRNNRITDCDYGIELAQASSGIDNNTILNCNVGIKLGDACPVDIINNTILSCSDCGIFDTERYGRKRIYNNYFNNNLNVRFGLGEGGNTWNNSLTRGTNIVGGPYIGGNFWAKPDGTGFSQISVDLDGNGIGDLPYNIYEDEFDYLPLVSGNSYLPLANFDANTSSGNAPLSVQFTDNSEKVTEWNWNFGDGTNSSEQNPMHTYSAAGNYTACLTVSNENGTDSKLATITVLQPAVYAYVTSSFGVYVIDTTTNTVTTRIDAGNTHGVTVSQDGTKVYVTNFDSDGIVSVIDTSTNTVTARVKVGAFPEGVAVSPDGKNVYVANWRSGNMSVIETSTNTIKATVDLGGNPCGVAVTPDGKKVYVTNWHGRAISVIDTATNNIITTVPVVGNSSYGVVVSPDGKMVYAANCYGRSISVINTTTDTVTDTIEVGDGPRGIAVSPDGKKVYVANEDKTVYIIDTTTNTVIAVVNMISEPFGIAVTPDGKSVYVVNTGQYYEDISNFDNNVSVIDTATNTVKTTVEVGYMPIGFGQFIMEKPVLETVPPVDVPVLPVANFSSNVTSGYAPLTVQFTDLSQNAVGRSWNFGDGAISNEQSPSHTFFSAGEYFVNLTVNNSNKTASKCATISVFEHSSSGGGSSGGAGGSPEPQSNVQAKELSQTFVLSGKAAKFDFPQKATPVMSVSFDSKKTTGKTTTIAEMLKGKSTLVMGQPSDEVYKYFNAWVGNSGFATPKNIENAVLYFKVEKSWVQDKKIHKSSITLNRYSDNTWDKLITILTSEDDNYLYFTTQTTGFSNFAITGNIITTVQPAASNEQTVNTNGTQTETNTVNTTPNTVQTPEQKQNTKDSGKESTKTSGFEMICGIVSLFAVVLYKASKKR